MSKRPWSLVVLAIFHLFAPVANIALNAIYIDASVGSYFSSALTWQYVSLNWPILIAPIVCGFAIYACKKWSFFIYLLSLGVLFLFSYQGYLSKSNILGIFPIVLVYAVNILIVAYFLVPEIRQIYFNPRLRWWENKPRYRADFSCEYQASEKLEETYSGHIGNFSVGGLFLKSKNFPEDNSVIALTFPFKGAPQTFSGRVILHRHQDAVGFGVEFLLTPETRKTAKRICKDLESQGHLLKTRYSSPEDDSFVSWAKTLLTTGKGLFPKKHS